MKNIYLVGHMGCGKSTIGPKLAYYLNVSFKDTDEMVKNMFEKPISQIFEEDGESQFRIYETAAILQTTLTENLVVATGGGSLQRARNGSYMKDYGIVIYLEIGVEEQLKRFSKISLEDRPLLAHTTDLRGYLKDLHEKRDYTYQYYADYTINVNNLDTDTIIKDIIAFIESENS